MKAGRASTPAQRVAEVARRELRDGWEVYGERLTHHEIHLAGRRVELLRGPVELEGFSLRLFRPRRGKLGVGGFSSNDLSPEGIGRAVEQAQRGTGYSTFPARSAGLTARGSPSRQSRVVDPRVKDSPLESIQEFTQSVLGQFPESSDVVPSFGSVRVTHCVRSVANSEGLDRRAPSTLVEFEWAVKASGGPEGRPAGEFWVNRTSRRLDPAALGVDVDRWCRLARDVRVAEAPPSGELPVIFPAEVLNDILPPVVGYRLSGAAELRKMGFAPGSVVGSEAVSVHDDPTLPWGTGSAGFDDEGVPTRKRTVVDRGRVKASYYDSLHASALGKRPTGSSWRNPLIGGGIWHHFTNPVAPAPSNMVVDAGRGLPDEELVELAREGIWLEQLGYAFPDPLSGAYGGEIRIGYRIRGGKLAGPVRGGTVGGVVLAPPGSPSLLSGITACGRARELVGGFRSPALLAMRTPVAGPQ